MLNDAAGPMTALAGVRVLDLSRLLPGPYLTRLLADLGAEVVKVEPPEGDLLRYLPPLAGEVAAAFSALNYGKRSLAVDLKAPGGAALVRALCAKADVLVESFRPGVMARLGLAVPELLRDNPRLVVCSLTGYGQSGEQQDAPGHDLAYVARAGLLALFGPPGAPPVVPGVQVADIAGAYSAAVGVLAALLERARTGLGRHLDVSMTRSAQSLLAMELPRRLAGAREPRGAGTLTGGLPCYRVYETRDGRHMALAALEPKFFADFCERAGCGHLARRGLEADPAVVSELAAVFRQRSQAEWVALLRGGQACCEPVLEPEEAVAEAALVGAGAARALATDVGAGAQSARDHHVPALGADGRAVLAELGLSPADIERAISGGALVLAPRPAERREYP